MGRERRRQRLALAFLLLLGMGFASAGRRVQREPDILYSGAVIPVLSESPDYLAEYPDGSKITKAYITTDSGLRELSKEEFAEILEIQRTQDTLFESETAENGENDVCGYH